MVMCVENPIIVNIQSNALFRIGSEHLFDANSRVGYSLVKDDEDRVIGFREAYKVGRTCNGFQSVIVEPTPARVIRQTYGLMESQGIGIVS